MRWKLIAIVSLVGGIVGFLLWETIGFVWIAPMVPWTLPDRRVFVVTALVPVSVAMASAFFVYRHTSKQRKLQAILTLLITLLLAITIFTAGLRLISIG